MRFSIIILAGALALAEPAGAAPGIGSVQEVFATAYQTPPAGARAAVAPRAGIVANERIETLADAAVGLRFVDDTVFRVGPDSNVVLDAFVFDPARGTGQAAIGILRGSMRFVTGRMQKENVRIVTPSAAIGIRGTDFSVIIHPGGVTDVAVFDGAVAVQPLQAAQSTVLTPGQYGRVTSPAGPVQVFSLPPSNRAGFIGIAAIDGRIAGLRTAAPVPFTPTDLPFVNPTPPAPVQPASPMPEYRPTIRN